jgi:hypothetical protein
MAYLITIIVVVIITILQFRSFIQTKERRAHFETIFPEKVEDELYILKQEGVQIASKQLHDLQSSKKEVVDLLQETEDEIQKIKKKIELYEKYREHEVNESIRAKYTQLTQEQNRRLYELQRVQSDYNKQLENSEQKEKHLADLNIAFSNGTRTEIISAINRYLEKNKNSVTDFNLIRDIIDRNCDAVEEEIQAQVPIPIYYGLMGTMIGIIFGAGSLVWSGSLWNLLTPFNPPLGVEYGTMEYDTLKEAYSAVATNGILSLFGGVAIATFSSIMGIILNVISSNKGKDTKSKVEAKKHAFISWLQAELLPKISSDFSSALIKLGHDLTGFNNSFASNANLLKRTISEISQATSAQTTLVQTIERLDITKIATANIQVYEKLEHCTKDLDALARSLNSIQHSIRGVGEFMEEGINEYERRNTYIQDASGKVDIAISEGQQKLTKATETIFQQYDELLNTLYLRTEATTKEIAEKYNKETERLHNAIVDKLTDVKRIEEELRNLVTVKTSMTNLEKATVAQNQKIDSLTHAIHALAQIKVSGGNTHVEMRIPKFYKVLIIASCAIISVAVLSSLVLSILSSLGVL